MEVYFFLWAYFLGPDKVWTLMDMPRTVSPPQLDPRAPPNRLRRPENGLKCIKLAIFHKITYEGQFFYVGSFF